MSQSLLRTKPLAEVMAGTVEEGRRLKKRLGPFELTALGIGCIIGVGIFVLPGVQAAKNAGPGIVLSFAIAASACACAALCYAELAAMIPGESALDRVGAIPDLAGHRTIRLVRL